MPEVLAGWENPSQRLVPASRSGRPASGSRPEGEAPDYPRLQRIHSAAPKGGSCGGKKRRLSCPSRRGWLHWTARRLQLLLGYLDKLLLKAADPALMGASAELTRSAPPTSGSGR